VPSSAEIDLAIVILEEVVQPYMLELNEALQSSSLNHDEKCNFVKLCAIAKFVISGISAFVVIGSPDNLGNPCSHWGSVLPLQIIHLRIFVQVTSDSFSRNA
jgi:hypothetical protein